MNPNSVRCALGALLLSAALGACRKPEPPKEPQPPAGEVWLTQQQLKDARLVVQPAELREVGGAIVTSGKVTFDDLKVSHVFSPVTGRVVKILAQPGQRVKKGAPLCVIESPDVGSAFADLGKAQADLVAAEHELNRQRELYEAHAGPQKDYEAAQDAYGRAKAELQRTQQKARMLRSDSVDRVSQEFTLRALIDGEIIARNVNPGAEVQGLYSGGNAVELFTIGEIDEVWVLADVFEMDLGRVRVSAPATVHVVSYPDHIFNGTVDWVSASLDPVSHTARVRCDIKNPDRMLRPEMYASVSIQAPGKRALAIPRTAILRLGDQTVVFVQAGAAPGERLRFERRPIAVSEDEGGDFLPVTHGMTEGDKVVTSGAILLSGML